MKLDYTWQYISGNETDFIFDDSKIVFDTTGATLIDANDTSYPYIINIEGVDYTFLKKLTTTSTTSSGSVIKLQISNDSDSWYYYNGEEWVENTFTETEVISGSNFPSEITDAVFEKFVYDIDAGKLFIKSFLITDGTEAPPILTSNQFTGDKYYSSIKEVRALLEPFGLRTCDPITGEVDPTTDFLSDARLKTLIPMADSYMNNKTYNDFYYHIDEVEYHDGNGKDGVNTYRFPITKITHVIMYNPLLQAMRTFLDFELIIHPQWGEIFLPPIYPAYLSDSPARSMFGNIFIHGRRNIEIQYDWGYTETPEDINTAAQRLTGIQVLNSYWANLTRGMQSKSFDGYSESYGQKPFAGIVEQWQLEINQIIDNRIRLFPRTI